MGKVRRLSNRELRAAIKRNELEEGMEKAVEWTRSHLENVLIGAVLLAVVAVLVPYWLSNRAAQKAQAAGELRVAMAEYEGAMSQRNVDTLRQARAKLQAVESAYPGSLDAAQAKLSVARADLILGEMDQAAANFQAFLSEYGENHPLAPLAVGGQAQVHESKGEWRQAADRYLSLEGFVPQAPNLGVALVAAARCLGKAGDKERALQVLEGARKRQKELGLSARLLGMAEETLK